MKIFAQLIRFGIKNVRIRSNGCTLGEEKSKTPGRGRTKPTRTSASSVEPRRGRRRIIFFHLTAMVVVLSPLVVGELVLRLCVPPPLINLNDPYVSFSGLRPLFVLDSTGTRFETAE